MKIDIKKTQKNLAVSLFPIKTYDFLFPRDPHFLTAHTIEERAFHSLTYLNDQF